MRQAGILFLFLILSFWACDNKQNLIELDIVETGCMNAWDDYYNGENDYRDAVEEYLEQNGISVYRVYAHTYWDGPVCLACSCPTGRLIVIRIEEEDRLKAEELGFQFVKNERYNVPENYGSTLVPGFKIHPASPVTSLYFIFRKPPVAFALVSPST
ncbi:hypothetical protein [uncultured Draconibacterium sp.]|uniref:hypothetical protein n=1 Tax=uncultured Draconibacterium sp. TaxID=1573823 RepID=UPI0032173AF3